MKFLHKTIAFVSGIWARMMCSLMLLSCTVLYAQTGSFTDRVATGSKTSKDLSSMGASAKKNVDVIADVVSLVAMLVGFVFLIWGIMWVMAAGRSEGRKEAKAGWIMILGGGALGAASAIYIFTVGLASTLGN